MAPPSRTRALTPAGTVVAAAGLALGALGAVTGYVELVVVSLMWLAAALAAVAATWRHPSVDADRSVTSARVVEGEAANAVLHLTRRGRHRRPWTVVVDTVGGTAVRVAVPLPRAGAAVSVSYALPAERRGAHDVGPLRLLRTDVLRLATGAIVVPTTARLVVVPLTAPVTPVVVPGLGDEDGGTVVNPAHGGETFHSLRAYVPGDDLRLVHWRSTARAGTLLVRETVLPGEPRALVVLDPHAGAYPGDTFEDAVRVAGSLCVATVRSGVSVRLRANFPGARPFDAAAPGAGGRVLDALALARPDDGDVGVDDVLRAVHPGDGSVAVLVTGARPPRQLDAVRRLERWFGAVRVVRVGPSLQPAWLGRIPVVDGEHWRDALAAWDATFARRAR